MPNIGAPFNEETGGTATGVCGAVSGAAPEVPVGVEWAEPGTCGGVGGIKPGAWDGVNVVEPGTCGGVDGAEPGSCVGVGPGVCDGVGGARDVLLEGDIFNGY